MSQPRYLLQRKRSVRIAGILRKPTAKFPEDPNPIREGVAPLKDAKKGKDIPPDARWTKIDRRLVNPEALEEAKERFEERMDCVIVLRVLTREDIQKLADRTREIRESREEEHNQRGSGDREREREPRDRDRDRDREHRSSHRPSSHRKHRDRDDDSYESDEDEESRERPRMIEPSREPRADFRESEREREREREKERVERDYWADPSRR
ncbi:hypothetical protein GTA08_BOTSDO12350 [Neofusicoccum parvum]|uniref:Uncharacterized protein n=1 Tax=Neofusicoccum parvum TaxID=310453 RepID=A0ACB5RQR2_9PEZI|nr:hypothetical protein GTA08_BOTSDO12350 [Neofusicoccum parvum]GME45562.1 hypothetical protein GTA08_BOTSDO12350 [Neofusicoccum parvum]